MSYLLKKYLSQKIQSTDIEISSSMCSPAGAPSTPENVTNQISPEMLVSHRSVSHLWDHRVSRCSHVGKYRKSDAIRRETRHSGALRRTTQRSSLIEDHRRLVAPWTRDTRATGNTVPVSRLRATSRLYVTRGKMQEGGEAVMLH